MQPDAARPDRTLITILSVIAVIVIVALVVVFTRGAPADVDPSTPEGVVQSYTRAVISNDRDAALGMLAADIRDNCDRAEPNNIRNLRMSVISTTAKANSAVVEVTIAHNTGGGLFGDSSYSNDASFTMVREDGAWKVEYTPWEFMLCFNQGKY